MLIELQLYPSCRVTDLFVQFLKNELQNRSTNISIQQLNPIPIDSSIFLFVHEILSVKVYKVMSDIFFEETRRREWWMRGSTWKSDFSLEIRTPLEDSRESVENNWARILGGWRSPNAPVSSNRYLIDRIRGSGIDRRPFRIARGFVTSMTDITRKLWSYWLAAFRIAIAKPFWPKPEIN